MSGPQQLEEKRFGVGWSIPLTQPPALTPVHPGGSSCCWQRGSPASVPAVTPVLAVHSQLAQAPAQGITATWVPSLPPDPFSPLPAPLSPSLDSSTSSGFTFPPPALCLNPFSMTKPPNKPNSAHSRGSVSPAGQTKGFFPATRGRVLGGISCDLGKCGMSKMGTSCQEGSSPPWLLRPQGLALWKNLPREGPSPWPGSP